MAVGKDASVADMRVFDADLVAQDSQLLDSALRRVFDMLPDGGQAWSSDTARQSRRRYSA